MDFAVLMYWYFSAASYAKYSSRRIDRLGDPQQNIRSPYNRVSSSYITRGRHTLLEEWSCGCIMV